MAKSREHGNERSMDRSQGSVSKEEKRRIDMELRGGSNLEAQEEEIGILGDAADQSGESGGQEGRRAGTDQALKSKSANPQGRRGGHVHH